MPPLFGSDESVKSVINYSISVYSVCSVDYLFSTEVTDGHGGELTITMFTRMDTEGINENVNDNDVFHTEGADGCPPANLRLNSV